MITNQMNPPTATYSGNMIRITWTAPLDNGSPITAYKIEILKTDYLPPPLE